VACLRGLTGMLSAQTLTTPAQPAGFALSRTDPPVEQARRTRQGVAHPVKRPGGLFGRSSRNVVPAPDAYHQTANPAGFAPFGLILRKESQPGRPFRQRSCDPVGAPREAWQAVPAAHPGMLSMPGGPALNLVNNGCQCTDSRCLDIYRKMRWQH